MPEHVYNPSASRRTESAFRTHRWRVSLCAVTLLAVLHACQVQPTDPVQPGSAPTGKPADDYASDVAVKWAALQLKLTRSTPGFTPPVAARAFGYAGLTMYESVVPGISNRRSLSGQLSGFTSLPQAESGQAYNWALSANAAQATILRALYPKTNTANKKTIDSLETALDTQFKDPSEAVTQRSVAFGRQVANAVFDWSKVDGGHEGYDRNFPASYVVPVGGGVWQPTENGIKIPMQPYWGQNRTFVRANSSLPMPKPLDHSTDTKSAVFSQYMDVYVKSKNLTQTEKEIAVWWADNPAETFTPPGHSYSIARIAVLTSNAGLAKAAETFARTGMAVADAFIMCWRCKFTFNNIRPYTYVRLAIDPAWVPFWPAPPFPGYPSGHATQSSSAATVLTAIYGEGFAFTDDSHLNRGRDEFRHVDFKPRSFRSFAESAQESADSRFYGNIHTRQDNETGLTEGRKIGANINALGWQK